MKKFLIIIKFNNIFYFYKIIIYLYGFPKVEPLILWYKQLSKVEQIFVFLCS